MALAAKSRLLRHLLLSSSHDDDAPTLILVGSSSSSDAKELLDVVYSPEKCGKDIALWDDEGVKVEVSSM